MPTYANGSICFQNVGSFSVMLPQNQYRGLLALTRFDQMLFETVRAKIREEVLLDIL